MNNFQAGAKLSGKVEPQGLINEDKASDIDLVLPIVRTLPAGCIAFEVPDIYLRPIVHQGDYLAIDVTDRLPVNGAFYLRRVCSEQNADWRSHSQRNRNIYIVQARSWHIRGDPAEYWMIGHRPLPGRKMYCDGPYSGPRFSDCIVGRVVAILAEDAPLPFATERVEPWGSPGGAGEEQWVAL